MSNVIPFRFKEVNIRIVSHEDGEPWFIAREVATLLGYSNVSDAISRHCKGGRETRLPSAGGDQMVKIIPERDVYRLIMRSKLPAAEEFEEWVVTEVLPSIRKNGAYSVQPNSLSRMDILKLAMAAENENIQLKNQLEEVQPKADCYDAIVMSEGAISIGEAAKVIGTGRNRLMTFLRQEKWVTKWNEPYQGRIESGHMDVKISQFDHPEKGLQRKITPLITGKGLTALQKLYSNRVFELRA